MKNKEIKKAKFMTQGLVLIGWGIPIALVEVFTGLALLIWNTKIALFLFGVSTVLLVLIIIMFLWWISSMRKERKNQ